jgi:hypothetical protein
MREFGFFLRAVSRHWWFLMATVVFAIFRFVPIFRSQPIPQEVYWIGILVSLFFAFFLAWRDEYRRAEGLKREIDEVYTDVVLDWLLQHHIKTFPAQALADQMQYPVEKVLCGLRILEKEFQLVRDDGAIGWYFDAERAIKRGMSSKLRRLVS